jgi:uncharacterized membrane protein (UPF0127 family)
MFPGCASATTPSEACVRGNCYALELALTPAQRAKGLMDHTTLLPGRGMWFVFEQPGQYGFWMKNMDFSIDILWIDGKLRIVDVQTNVPPCARTRCEVYYPSRDALYVLELPAGEAERLQIVPGDKIELKG